MHRRPRHVQSSPVRPGSAFPPGVPVTAVGTAAAPPLGAVAIGTTSTGRSRKLRKLQQLADRYKILVDFSGGYLLISTLGEHASLGVVAAKTASLGAIAYQMTRFIQATGPGLTRETVIDLATSAAGRPLRTGTG